MGQSARCDLEKIRGKTAGHGSPIITLKTYGHMFGNTDAGAAAIMEATFAKVRAR